MLSVTGSAVFRRAAAAPRSGRRIWKRFLRQRAEADELIYALIEDRARLEDNPANLLSRLLWDRNDGRLADVPRQVRDNLMSIVLAGHETTASELAWAFQLLAHNPVVLEKLIEEIDDGHRRRVSDGDDPGGAAPPARVPVHDPTSGQAADRDRRLDLPPAGSAAGVHLSVAPRPGAVPGAATSSGPSASWGPRRQRRRGCRGVEAASAVPACIWPCSR